MPIPISLPEIKMVGLPVRTCNNYEMEENSSKIPKLWEDFHKDKVIRKIPNIKNANKIMGVYTEYEEDSEGFYTMVLGTEVSEFGEIPEELVGVSIADSRYLKFPAEGELPDSVVDTWGNIWQFFQKNTDYLRTYSADFEIYDLDNLETVDIFISV